MKTVLLITLLFITQFFYCQISGKVIDQKGNPLSQVSVTINDTIAETDKSGFFILSSKLATGKIDILFQHPRRGARILIKNFPTKKVREIEFEMPKLLEYFGEVIDKNQFIFIPCLCYTNQSYPYYKNRLESNFIEIKVNHIKYKITNYKFDELKNLFVVNWSKK